jgi:WhiB family redox-sensing transcriptional regulator
MLEPEFAAFPDEQLAYAIAGMNVLRPAWTRQAACRGWDTSLWFPERGDPDNGRIAKKICGSCPVSAECLADALSFGAQGTLGIWGGLSAPQRRRARPTP